MGGKTKKRPNSHWLPTSGSTWEHWDWDCQLTARNQDWASFSGWHSVASDMSLLASARAATATAGRRGFSSLSSHVRSTGALEDHWRRSTPKFSQ